MKTVVVLSALVAVVVTAPTLSDKGYEKYKPANRPSLTIRHKKSPLINQEPIVEEALPFTQLEDETPEISARSLFVKNKPIIVKKKLGYHLYRDSDEEQAQADSREACTKQVKVKLCDAEVMSKASNKIKAKNSDIEDASEAVPNEMEQSIKMAKEAVENLQKASQWKQGDTGKDSDLHEDIEVARQALEHIQKNFGHFESMNLKTRTLSDAEALKDAHFEIANTEEERLAQWKDAMSNIQKNVEIARNIEDTFKSANPELQISEDEDKEMKDALDMDSDETSMQGKSAEEFSDKIDMVESPSEPKEVKVESHEDKLSESLRSDVTTKEKSNEDDSKKLDELSVDTGRDATEQNIKPDLTGKAKSSEIDSSMNASENEKPSTIKDVEEDMENKSAEKEIPKSPGKSDKMLDMDTAASLSNYNIEKTSPLKSAEVEMEMKSSEKEADDSDKILDEKEMPQNKESESEIENKSIEKQTLKTPDEFDKIMDLETSSAEPNTKKEAENNVPRALDESMFVSEKKEEEGSVNANIMPKSTENDDEMLENKNIVQAFRPEINTDAKAVEFDNKPDLNMSDEKEKNKALGSPVIDNLGLKSAENTESVDVPQTPDSLTMKSANEMGPLGNFEHVSSQAETQNDNLNLPQTVKAAEHDLLPASSNLENQETTPNTDKMASVKAANGNNNDFHNAENQMRPHSNVHHQNDQFIPRMMAQGKAAEFDSGMPLSQFEKSTMERNMGPWGRAAARGPYGSYGPGAGAGAGAGAIANGLNLAGASGGGAGASAVFPGANLSPCAVPLLLSCSPNVVAGSLAKSHSYGTPAYRNNEEFNFHNKRDTKKNQIKASKVKRTTKIARKFPTTYVKKF